jgi:hypothetical protein
MDIRSLLIGILVSNKDCTCLEKMKDECIAICNEVLMICIAMVFV